MINKICFFFIFLLATVFYAQETDISQFLRAVESGDIESAQAGLKKLKSSKSDDPSIIYLDAVLSRDGKEALSKYQKVAESFPQSKYADASLFRIYSYYYAAGLYNTAQKFYDKLKTDYPSSSYLKKERSSIEEDFYVQESKNIKNDVEEVSEIIDTPGKVEKPEPEKVYKYTIQTGAFLVNLNAQNLKKTFQKAGYYSEVKDKKVGGSTFSVVFLGRFETEDDAKDFLNDLNKRQKIDGRVVPIE